MRFLFNYHRIINNSFCLEQIDLYYAITQPGISATDNGYREELWAVDSFPINLDTIPYR